MIATVTGLSLQMASKYAEELARMDAACMQYDPLFSDEAWEQEHYTRDYDSKWKLSQIAFSHTNSVAGALIATETNKTYCHLNRLLVSPQYRRNGIAEKMMLDFQMAAIREGYWGSTLFVHTENSGAIKFYNKMGWKICSGAQFKEIAALKGRFQTKDNCFIDKSGLSNYIMFLNLLDDTSEKQ